MGDDSRRRALLVIDMLNFFSEEGDPGYQERFWSVARRIREARVVLRELDVPMIFVNTCFGSEAAFRASPMADVMPLHWLRGTHEAAVVDFLHPEPHDYVVEKTVNSGFFETDLDRVLHRLGVTQVAVAGVHTHVCVMLTAADAFYRRLRPVVMSDCVTTIETLRHVEALGYIERHFGSVQTMTEFEQGLRSEL